MVVGRELAGFGAMSMDDLSDSRLIVVAYRWAKPERKVQAGLGVVPGVGGGGRAIRY